IFGNRAIYQNGWLAGTVHRAPWEFKPRATFENDKWELYDTRSDFSLTNDLATKNTDKLKELQDLFLKEAVKYSVLPLDDRTLERLNAAMVGRQDRQRHDRAEGREDGGSRGGGASPQGGQAEERAG